LPTPAEKYTSAFFSGSVERWRVAASRALSRGIGHEEDVCLFLVLRHVRLGAGFGLFAESRHLADGQVPDGLGEQLAVVREILDQLERARKRHDGHHVRGVHRRLQELERRLLGADLLHRLHRGQIKEEHDEAAVPVANFGGRRSGFPGLGGGRRRRSAPHPAGGKADHRRQRVGGQPLELENGDGLGLAVLEKLEVFLLQTLDSLPRAVAHADVDHHQVARHLETHFRLLAPHRRQTQPGEEGCRQPAPPRGTANTPQRGSRTGTGSCH
jgi:hypothetical protein